MKTNARHEQTPMLEITCGSANTEALRVSSNRISHGRQQCVGVAAVGDSVIEQLICVPGRVVVPEQPDSKASVVRAAGAVIGVFPNARTSYSCLNLVFVLLGALRRRYLEEAVSA
jgi:hypothetical protein